MDEAFVVFGQHVFAVSMPLPLDLFFQQACIMISCDYGFHGFQVPFLSIFP